MDNENIVTIDMNELKARVFDVMCANVMKGDSDSEISNDIINAYKIFSIMKEIDMKGMV